MPEHIFNIGDLAIQYHPGGTTRYLCLVCEKIDPAFNEVLYHKVLVLKYWNQEQDEGSIGRWNLRDFELLARSDV